MFPQHTPKVFCGARQRTLSGDVGMSVPITLSTSAMQSQRRHHALNSYVRSPIKKKLAKDKVMGSWVSLIGFLKFRCIIIFLIVHLRHVTSIVLMKETTRLMHGLLRLRVGVAMY